MSSQEKDYIDQLDALLEDPSASREELAERGGFGVLLALTEDKLAASAIAVTRALDERRGATPAALYVIEISASVPEAAVVIVSLEEELENPRTRERQTLQMRKALRLDRGPVAAWPLTLAVGSVPQLVAEHARRNAARMVVLGLNRHGAAGRVMGRDTVRGVMEACSVPVLAVRPELTDLPKRIVVPVDFSRASIRAARFARQVIDEHGSMHLVFVEPPKSASSTESEEGTELIRTRGVEAAFDQLVRDLRPSVGIRIDTTVRHGSPVTEILRLAEESDADLIAIGSQRHGFVDRLLLGSVAKAITADARWSVLVTPPGDATQR